MSDMTLDQASSYEDEERPEVKGEWRVANLVDLDWCLKRIGELELEKSDNEQMARVRIAEIQVRLEKLNARAQFGIGFFQGKIREYAEAHRDELITGKKKSRAFIHGSIGWRKTGGAPVKVNPESLLEWARSQPIEKGFLRIREEPAWDTIKEHVKNTGEVPNGVDLEPEDEFGSFRVEPLIGGSRGDH